ncbi:MAG: DUF6580 family putative transport protein [Planctomycetota bacterium]|nr:DUF6580 family putative transport protein [Planctomycetota bacterium]
MFYLLIVVAAASRFLPHPPNVACVGALGLFAGCYLSGRKAYLVPLGVMLLSDLVGEFVGFSGIGLYNPLTMAFVYGGLLMTIPVGRWMRSSQAKLRIPAGSLAASSVFFLISNFGVWLGGWYSLSAAGLIACYANAIPFFGYTIAGDLAFTVILFGTYEFSRKTVQLPVSLPAKP